MTLLTRAWQATGDPLFADARRRDRRLARARDDDADGAFAASLDADCEGEEGKFYVWTRATRSTACWATSSGLLRRAYDVTADGNWEGDDDPQPPRTSRLSPAADEKRRLADARAKLLARRDRRVRPARDDKVLADWNGLMIAALAFAGATFSRPDWIAMADRAFRFITGPMARGDRLAHSWRDNKSVFPGLATDYADMITAALALHAATLEPGYLATAEKLAATLRSHHRDDATPGYFLSADDAEALIVRPRSVTDEATPSANSVMAQNLVRLWHLTGTDAYREDADAIIQASAPAVAAQPVRDHRHAVGARPAPPCDRCRHRRADRRATVHSRRHVRRHWTPNTILSVHAGAADLPPSHPASGKTPVDGKPTAYVCQAETCSLPATDSEALVALLRN